MDIPQWIMEQVGGYALAAFAIWILQKDNKERIQREQEIAERERQVAENGRQREDTLMEAMNRNTGVLTELVTLLRGINGRWADK